MCFEGQEAIMNVMDQMITKFRSLFCFVVMVSTPNEAEHVLTVMDGSLPVNFRWYLDHQLKNPMLQMMKLLMAKPESLFTLADRHGVQLNKKAKITSKLMSSFVKVRQRCRICNGVVASSRGEGICPTPP